MILWAKDVISVAERSIVSDGSESGGCARIHVGIVVLPPLDFFLEPHGGIRAPRTELTF